MNIVAVRHAHRFLWLLAVVVFTSAVTPAAAATTIMSQQTHHRFDIDENARLAASAASATSGILGNACVERASRANMASLTQYPWLHVYFAIPQPSDSLIQMALMALANATCFVDVDQISVRYVLNDAQSAIATMLLQFPATQQNSTAIPSPTVPEGDALERNSYVYFNVYVGGGADVAQRWLSQLQILSITPAAIRTAACPIVNISSMNHTNTTVQPQLLLPSACVTDATFDNSQVAVDRTSVLTILGATAGALLACGGCLMLWYGSDRDNLRSSPGGEETAAGRGPTGRITDTATFVRVALPSEVDASRIVIGTILDADTPTTTTTVDGAVVVIAEMMSVVATTMSPTTTAGAATAVIGPPLHSHPSHLHSQEGENPTTMNHHAIAPPASISNQTYADRSSSSSGVVVPAVDDHHHLQQNSELTGSSLPPRPPTREAWVLLDA